MRSMANVRATSGAALKLPLPGWLAVTVHVPVDVKVTVAGDTGGEPVPDTVQLPVATNVTGKREVAVAVTWNGAVPYVWSPGCANVMLCAAFAMVKLCTCCGAGL